MIKIKIHDGGFMPERGTEGSSGLDIRSPVAICIRPDETVVIHCNFSIEMPDHTWECQVRGRSSMAKRGLLASLGTIDSDYRGVVGATMFNSSKFNQNIEIGDKIAQIVFCRVEHPVVESVDELGTTTRGTGGFGSTGR